MHQGRRLKGLAGRLMGQLLGRQNAELLVHQWQQFVCSPRVPPFYGVQDARDITHADSPPLRACDDHILCEMGRNLKRLCVKTPLVIEDTGIASQKPTLLAGRLEVGGQYAVLIQMKWTIAATARPLPRQCGLVLYSERRSSLFVVGL
jgi:hypothetical protein